MVHSVQPGLLLTVHKVLKISIKPLCPFVIDLLFKTEGQTQRPRAHRRTMQAFESLKAMRARIMVGHRELLENFGAFLYYLSPFCAICRVNARNKRFGMDLMAQMGHDDISLFV